MTTSAPTTPTFNFPVPAPAAVPSTRDASGRQGSFRAWCEGFFSLDLRSLALFRVALAVILLVDLGIRYTDLEMHYADGGIAPRATGELFWTGSVHSLNGSVAF